MDYYSKYLKYKTKYINLSNRLNKNQVGGRDIKSKKILSPFSAWLKENHPEEYTDLFEDQSIPFYNYTIKNYEEPIELEKKNELPNTFYSDKLSIRKKPDQADNPTIPENPTIQENPTIPENPTILTNIMLSDNPTLPKIVDLEKIAEPEYINDIHTNKIIRGGTKTAESWGFIIEKLKEFYSSDRLSVKISLLSDPFKPEAYDSDYGGVIFWHNNGEKNIIGDANVITVIIQDTRKWDPSEFGTAGNGIVHDKLYKDLMGYSIHNEGPAVAACYSGFSFIYSRVKQKWVVKFSSAFANSNTVWTEQIRGCDNNSSKMTTYGEAAIIIGSVYQWIRDGVGSEIILSNISEDVWSIWSRLGILHDQYQYPVNERDFINLYDPTKWEVTVANPDFNDPHCSR